MHKTNLLGEGARDKHFSVTYVTEKIDKFLLVQKGDEFLLFCQNFESFFSFVDSISISS